MLNKLSNLFSSDVKELTSKEFMDLVKQDVIASGEGQDPESAREKFTQMITRPDPFADAKHQSMIQKRLTVKPRVVEDFFDDEDFLKKMNEYIMKLFQNSENPHNFSTNYSWDPQLNFGRMAPPPVLVHYLDRQVNNIFAEEAKEISDYIKLMAKDKLKEEKAQINAVGPAFYIWTPGAAINWHDDSSPDRYAALTIYLNEFWDFHYGGTLHYQERNGQPVTVIPKRNSAVFLPAGHMHTTRPVFTDQLRVSIQCWLGCTDDGFEWSLEDLSNNRSINGVPIDQLGEQNYTNDADNTVEDTQTDLQKLLDSEPNAKVIELPEN